MNAIPAETAAKLESDHTASRKGAPTIRMDLIPRDERRRHWTTGQKQTIAAQSLDRARLQPTRPPARHQRRSALFVAISLESRPARCRDRRLQPHGPDRRPRAAHARDRDPGQVDVVRRFGNKVWFGDPTRPDLLRAPCAEQAKRPIVAPDDRDAVLRTVEVARPNVPNLKVFARARNRRHAHLLMDRTVDGLVRDTFHSSPGLAEDSLIALGIPAEDAAHSVALFRDHDERNSIEAQAIYRDEKQLIQSTQQVAEELTSLFEADRRGDTR